MPRADLIAPKPCSRCHEMITTGRKHAYCKKCAAEYARERRLLDDVKERSVAIVRNRMYGLAPRQYDAMVRAQQGLCAICQNPETSTRRGKIRTLCVDHDHDSGQIRGLLCARCNTALGLLNDDPMVLAEALAYLRKWKNQPWVTAL